jgi:hypothetical protein
MEWNIPMSVFVGVVHLVEKNMNSLRNRKCHMLVRRMVWGKVYGKLSMINCYHQNARYNYHIQTSNSKRLMTVIEGVMCRMQHMWKSREFHTRTGLVRNSQERL